MDQQKLRQAGAYTLAAQGAKELAELWKDSNPEEAATFAKQAKECEQIAEQLSQHAWSNHEQKCR